MISTAQDQVLLKYLQCFNFLLHELGSFDPVLDGLFISEVLLARKRLVETCPKPIVAFWVVSSHV